jgi:hypothetical protein
MGRQAFRTAGRKKQSAAAKEKVTCHKPAGGDVGAAATSSV